MKSRTEKLFAEEKESIHKALKRALKISNICITVDIWTDEIRHLSYLGAVCHYLDRDEVTKKHTLCTKAIALKVLDAEDDKTAENAHEAVMHVLMDYDLYH